MSIKAVVIGTSAGALEALSMILPAMPKQFPAAVMIVVHVPANRPSLLSELLQARCQLPVYEVEDKQPLLPGTVYVAPPDYHLLVDRVDQLALSTEAEVMFSRPSIDVLFESAADVFGQALLGIVLSGANSDGAMGLRSIMQAGGQAWIQEPLQARASAMPQSAIAACPMAEILTLEAMGQRLGGMV